MEKKTFRLIGKEGYFQSNVRNEEFFDKYFTSDGEITIQKTGEYLWRDQNIIISPKEWKFFEEIVDEPTIPIEFKVEDKVKIRKDSKYYGIDENFNPTDKCGVVVGFYDTSDSNIRVMWEGHYENDYNAKDLEFFIEEDEYKIEHIPAKPEEFVTPDGCSFPTLEEAEKHLAKGKLKTWVTDNLSVSFPEYFMETLIEDADNLINILKEVK